MVPFLTFETAFSFPHILDSSDLKNEDPMSFQSQVGFYSTGKNDNYDTHKF